MPSVVKCRVGGREVTSDRREEYAGLACVEWHA
jgi:hypothetical protein